MNPADESTLDAIFFATGFTLSVVSVLPLAAGKQVGFIPLISGTLLLTTAPLASAWMYGWGREAYKEADRG